MARYISGLLAINPINAIPTMPQGRLTLTTLQPVLAATVSASATVRYTPFIGNRIPIWNGSSFEMRTFSELTNTLADATDNPAAGAAAKVYDLFVGYKNGNLILARDVAWTNDTTPASGASTTPRLGLNRIQGVLVNEVAITNAFAAGYGTYVGTIRTDAGGATVSYIFGAAAAGGTAAWIGLWNAYNRLAIQTRVEDSTAAYALTAATIRPADNSANMRVSFVRGLNIEGVIATYQHRSGNVAAALAFAEAMIGLDATNAKATDSSRAIMRNQNNAAAGDEYGQATYSGLPGLGFHFLSACEAGDGTNANVLGGTGGYSVLSARFEA